MKFRVIIYKDNQVIHNKVYETLLNKTIASNYAKTLSNSLGGDGFRVLAVR